MSKFFNIVLNIINDRKLCLDILPSIRLNEIRIKFDDGETALFVKLDGDPGYNFNQYSNLPGGWETSTHCNIRIKHFNILGTCLILCDDTPLIFCSRKILEDLNSVLEIETTGRHVYFHFNQNLGSVSNNKKCSIRIQVLFW